MIYTFICDKCNKEKEIGIPVSEYDEQKDNQYCECKKQNEKKT